MTQDTRWIFRAPSDLKARFNKVCAIAGVNASEQLRQLIQAWIDDNEQALIDAKIAELQALKK